jgi:hypothetical protein
MRVSLLMRPLLIDDAAKAEVKRVRDHAEALANLYRPGITQKVPGDDPSFCAHLHHGFRCVFTITEMQGIRYRHLTISVTGEKYPNPIAAYTIAELFGFEGWDGRSEEPPPHWQGGVNQREHCVVLAEALSDRDQSERLA